MGFGSTAVLGPNWKVWCWQSRFSVKLDSVSENPAGRRIYWELQAWMRTQREGQEEDLVHPTDVQEDELLVHTDRSSG